MSGNQKQAPSGAPQQQRYLQGPYSTRVSTPQRADGYHAGGFVPSQTSNPPPNQGPSMRGMPQPGPPNQPSTPPQIDIKQNMQSQGQISMTYIQPRPHQPNLYRAQPHSQGGSRMQNQHRQTMTSTVAANTPYFSPPITLLSQMPPPPMSYPMHMYNAQRHTQYFQHPVTQVLPNPYVFNTYTQPTGQTASFYFPNSSPMQITNRPPTQVQPAPQTGAQTAQQPQSLPPVVIPQVKNKLRPNALAIVDPVSGKQVNVDEQEVPTSSESSAREPPQTGVISSVLVEYDCAKPSDIKDHVEAEHIPLFEPPVLPQHHNPSSVRIHPHGGLAKENNVYHKIVDSSIVQHSKLQASTKEFIPDNIKHTPKETTTPVVSANSDGVEVTLPNKTRERESPSKTRRPHRESIPKESLISESAQSLPSKEIVVTLPVAAIVPPMQEVVDIQMNKPIPTPNAKTRSNDSKPTLPDQRTSVMPPPIIIPVEEDLCIVSTGKKKESQKLKETTSTNQVQQPSKPAMPVPGSQPTKPSSKANKMRELNIKGANKEGTDMDAFSSIEAPAIDNYNNEAPAKEEEIETPVLQQPPLPQMQIQPQPVQQQQQLPVQPAPQLPPPVQKLSDVKTMPKMTVDVTSIVKDDAPRFSKPQVSQPPQQQPTTDSQDETDRVACEKLVQVKNETNRSKSENTDSQAIDKTVVRYKKDQWSPVNPDGQKRYEPDFLRFLLKSNPKCQKKPESLPDLDIIVHDSNNRPRTEMRAFPNRQPEMLMPSFHKASSQRGSVTKRGSQQGKANMKGGKPTTIHVSLSLREDVKLRETENAWKPARMVANAKLTEEEIKTNELYKKVRGVLNKLTPEKFEKLVGQVRELPIDNTERLQGVIDLVFEKAVDEPNFSVAYALMCKELGMIQVPASTKDQAEHVNFRKLIITRCQMEFEKNSQDEKAQNQKMKEVEECTDPEKKKELTALVEEQERRIRMKSVGNIRFIGELFKQSMLTPKIMVRCILDLLKNKDEDRLECLCKLLTTIGKELESSQSLALFFNQMQDIVEKKHGRVSSRVRFMLQDVIDLRNSLWIPRRQDLNPKKMEQIQKEADTEQLNIQVMNSGSMNTPRKDDRMGGGNRGDDRKRRNNQPDDSGWSTAGSRGRATAYTVESHKLMNKPPPINDMTLGSKNLFDRWGTGSNFKTQMHASVTNTTNMYAPLEKLNLEQDNSRAFYDSRMNKTPYSSKGHSTERSSYNKHNYNDGRNSRSGSQHRNPPTSQHQQQQQPLQQQKLVQPSVTAAPVPVVPIIPLLNPEQLKLRMKNIMDEYLNDCCLLEDSISDIHANLRPSDMHEFIVQIYNEVLERSDPMRLKAGKLIARLVTMNVVSIDVVVEALKEVLSQADDLVIDIPKLWDYLALMILPLVTENVLTLKKLVACKSVFNDQRFMPELLAELLKHLVKDNGANYVFDLWRISGVQFTDFLTTDVDNYVKQHKLDFLIGGAGVPVAQKELSWEQVYLKLLQLLKSETAFNTITDWIETNLGERVKENQFIRTLVTAIIENDIVSINCTKKLKEELLKGHFGLFQRYIDNNEAFELHCLFALQALAHKWEHPQGLLLSICEKLWDANIISSDALESWEKDTNPAEKAGKTVAFMSLQRLFTATKEGDDEESASESVVDEADGDED